jgi:hypothetical protein
MRAKGPGRTSIRWMSGELAVGAVWMSSTFAGQSYALFKTPTASTSLSLTEFHGLYQLFAGLGDLGVNHRSNDGQTQLRVASLVDAKDCPDSSSQLLFNGMVEAFHFSPLCLIMTRSPAKTPLGDHLRNAEIQYETRTDYTQPSATRDYS